MYRYRNNCPCEKPKAVEPKPIDDENKCQCGFADEQNVFPTNFMYGQSYVPIQHLNETFKPEVGLKMGSLFPELVSPYEPGDSMCEIAYLRKKTGNLGQCCDNSN